MIWKKNRKKRVSKIMEKGFSLKLREKKTIESSNFQSASLVINICGKLIIYNFLTNLIDSRFMTRLLKN